MKTNIFRSMFISAACLVLLAFAACSRDDNPKTPEALISINPSSLILESTDVSATFTLTCNQAWNISTTETWITQISPSSGTEGSSNVVITIETEVNENDLRSGKLIIECGSKKQDMTVSQAGSSGAPVLGQVFLMKATLSEDEMGFNLLSDPSFEDHATETIDYKSPWWILASKRSSDAHTGSYSAKQNFVEPENLGFQTFAARPHTDYEITAWFKSNKAMENPDVYLGIRKSIEGRPVLLDVNKGASIGDSWKQESVQFNSAEYPLLEAFAFEFTKDGYTISWDDVCVKRPGDTQKSYKLTDLQKVGSLYEGFNGAVTSSDGCTVWDAGNGKTMIAFGQNIGRGERVVRQNALAVSSDSDPSNGLTAVFASKDGKPAEMLAPVGGTEKGIVPTAGVAVGDRQWVHYMSIKDKQFAEDMWTVNHSGLAYSDDSGVTWVRSDVKWDANSNFVQVALLRDNGYVYMYGAPAGRISESEQYVKLARAAEAEMATKDGWKYWNGSDWVADASAAVPLIYVGTLGELSVIKNRTTGRYLMTYSSIKRDAIVIRDAAVPEGEWSGEKIVCVDNADEILSAPSFLPISAEGKTAYFLMSSAWGK